MTDSTLSNAPSIQASWQWSRDELAAWQVKQFNKQIKSILPDNRLYHAKFAGQRPQLKHLDQIAELPLTIKQELVDSAAVEPGGVSAHHTFSPERYSRLHRTSGTSGRPLLVFDTHADWQWWSHTWQHVLQAAEVTSADRVFLAFSFGPFIGFWSAHQACVDRGATVVPGGGLSSLARLEFIRQAQATVVCCTPSYALHLAEVARHENVELAELGVRCLIVAGEAGGSIPAVRAKLQQDWQAQIIDHAGATEVGPWGFGWPAVPGLHIIESSFIAELLPMASASEDSPLCELVLTSLGRYGAPLIRYRTGDIVYAQSPPAECNFTWLPEGVVGRADDMVIIRGVNVFPSSIDDMVRRVAGIGEYRVCVDRDGALDRLRIEVEATMDEQQQELEKLLATRLGLRIVVQRVPQGSLQPSEHKARRWVDQRFREG